MKESYRDPTFFLAWCLALLGHLFLLSVVKVQIATDRCLQPQQTRIAFIADQSTFFYEEAPSDVLQDILDAVFSAGDATSREHDVATFLNDLAVISHEKTLDYQQSIEEDLDRITYADVKINSQRKLLRLYYPIYPTWAKKMGLESEVKVKIGINALGHVRHVVFEQMSPYASLDANALRAIRRWRFQPSMEQKDQWAHAVLKFELDK